MDSLSKSLEPGFPLVTAVGLCYNHERHVRDCLESIKQQAYPNLEIIIADDCSKDSSPLLIREWIRQNHSLPITFIQNEQNQGVCRTLNRVLALARGKYISMTATDDVWEPGKILEQVPVMESLPEKTGVLYGDACLMDENGLPLPDRFVETYRKFERMPEGNIHDVLWEGNFIPAMTTLIRRSVFEKVGLYDENLFYEDWDMWLRVSEHYHFAYFPRPTAKYRVSMTSMSKTSVDEMTLANELTFIKYLLRKRVPKQVRNQAFNFAIRRAYRQKATTPGEARNLLSTMVRLYGSPRLIYAWILYMCGFEYRHYEDTIKVVKRITQFAR
jgi:glycosyltransferase involved in cell wall biosynthesis